MFRNSSIIFTSFNYLFFAVFIFTILYPFWDLLLLSLSDSKTANSLGFRIWINEFTLSSYKYCFSNNKIGIAYFNSIFRTVVGTFLTTVVSLFTAYPLTKRDLPGQKVITTFFLFTMFFGGGLIPTYLVIRSLGLVDSLWVLILPTLISASTVIIVRNTLMTMDKAFEEAAFIDGADYFTILFKVIIPLSKPIIATIAVWTAVAHWNSWYDCLLYIRDDSKVVLQLILQRMLDLSRADADGVEAFNSMQEKLNNRPVISATIRAAITIITIGPIIIVYPFAQKYFVKGFAVGAVKG